MKPFPITLISASLLLAGSSVCAEKIFGSVDQKGNITFSDHVPVGAVKSKEVNVDPSYPSQESQEATRATTRQMIDAADQNREEIENTRKTRKEVVEKRRSRIEADQQGSQQAPVVPPGNGYVIERDGYAPEYQDYFEQLQEVESEAKAILLEESR